MKFKEMEIEKISELFVDNLVETNRGFDFYVNWENAEDYKDFEIELNAMNVLIRTDDIKSKFYELAKKLPTFIATFPLLFALSKNERQDVWNGKNSLLVVNEQLDGNDNFKYDFNVLELKKGLDDSKIDEYYILFDRIGLKHLFENLLTKSVIDYVIGVLVGLDTNGRKNRGGTAFEDACEPIISEICDHYGIKLISQKQFKVLRELGFEISEDVANRKADFILVKNEKILNIEVDYFFRGGSKPEEIIDSYINRQNDLAKINIGFALLTDGMCWDNKAKNQLQKGFRNLDNLMNYHLSKIGMLEEIISEYFN
ncbi:MAG: type II restriction endonuclease [Bacilli bacterium]|nr:type II restriction endonuclease [Bacilli bacterium]